MLSMPLRKQGGAAIVTIPSSVLKSLNLKIGEPVAMEVRDGQLVMTPATRRKRYSTAELLKGTTRKTVKIMLDETAWARAGNALGRELA
ncbi:MAG: AbrB/MazE/SpoVT family DNA-binding domain-containing protein [Burkholderiales bacterium]